MARSSSLSRAEAAAELAALCEGGLLERWADKAERLSVRWEPVARGAWSSALGGTVLEEAPVLCGVVAGPGPCEEAEAVLAG